MGIRIYGRNGFLSEIFLYRYKKIPPDIHDKFESLLREFLVVGGMPEVVADFAIHKDFTRVQEIQDKILLAYADDIAGHAKGGIYENFLAEMLMQNGYTLHYYKPDGSSELEFVIEKDGEVIPIEVKAGNAPTKSLDAFLSAFDPSVALKFISGNVGKTDRKLTLPHFLAMFL